MAEAEDGKTVLVCLRVESGNPGGFEDNVYGECERCHARIQWRPNAIACDERICMECGDPNAPIFVTAETLGEYIAWAMGQQAAADLAPRLRRPPEWDQERACVQCGKPVEKTRRCYAQPTCYACLPPPQIKRGM
jgi:hypothetical protein